MPEVGPALAKWIDEFSSLRGRAFGPLEYKILRVLWKQAPLTVWEMRPYFPRAAYTTLMTTLDRLYKKGLLHRKKRGNPNVYWPALSRVELQKAILHSLGEGIRSNELGLPDGSSIVPSVPPRSSDG